MSRKIFFWGLHALQTVTTSKVKKLFPSHCSVKRNHRRFNGGPGHQLQNRPRHRQLKGKAQYLTSQAFFEVLKLQKDGYQHLDWDRGIGIHPKIPQNIQKNIKNLGLGITNNTNCTFQSFWLAFQFQNFHPGQRHVSRFCHQKQRSSTQVWCNAKRVKKKGS